MRYQLKRIIIVAMLIAVSFGFCDASSGAALPSDSKGPTRFDLDKTYVFKLNRIGANSYKAKGHSDVAWDKDAIWFLKWLRHKLKIK